MINFCSQYSAVNSSQGFKYIFKSEMRYRSTKLILNIFFFTTVTRTPETFYHICGSLREVVHDEIICCIERKILRIKKKPTPHFGD